MRKSLPHTKNVSADNIFNFIDSKEYEKYADEHPAHDLIKEFKQRFVTWRGGVDPFTGQIRSDAALAGISKKSPAELMSVYG